RSYALAVRKTGAFDLYADTRSQVYAGVEAERPSTNEAVDATAGQVVLYGGKVATTYFYSSSGGRTASIQDVWNARPVPYLVSVADPYDTISPHHSWGPVVFTSARLAKVLKVPGALVDVQAPLNSSGRVQEIVATGTRGQVTVAAKDVRSMLGLDSTWFSLGQLSLSKPAKSSVAYGSRLRLDGVARGVTAPVLQQRPPHGTWTSSGALAVAQDGTLGVVVKPAAATEYRLAVNGVAASGVVKISVQPVVRLTPPTDPTTLRGTFKPALENTLVQVQRNDGVAWRTVATARSSADGAFAAQLTLNPGNYRARVAPGHGLAVGLSQILKVVAQ
ncbi:MAG: hypothetical protein QOE36_1430, partial [Gaiellaceae bacterium]|nr:hypothetical protein [Gaiellaceae bacterium]